MILDIIRNGFSVDLLVSLVARAFIVFCVLPVHEFAHAFVANKLGDDTARLKGRLTLAPMAHLDLIGALMIFLVGFGYAKPVPVNPRRFKNQKAGMAITALAGPVSNIIMGFICALFANALYVWHINSNMTLIYILYLFFSFAFQINISLAVFNLIPVPPLDGSRILNVLLPSKYYFKIMQYERYIMIGVFILLFTNILTTPLAYIVRWVCTGIDFVAELPFRAFL